MKKFILILIVALICWNFLYADTYIKEKQHTDAYYDGGQVQPAEDRIVEIWISDKKIAYTIENQSILVDLEKSWMTFINHRNKIYAETPSPLDMSKIIGEQLYSMLQVFKTKGTVKETDETKKIGEWNCTAYEINIWRLYEGSPVEENDAKCWITNDVPFDLNPLKDVLLNTYRFQNYDEELVQVLMAIKGFQIVSERTKYSRGLQIKVYTEVVEIASKDPPDGTYSIPEGYTKKDKLTYEDIESIIFQ